MTDLQVFVAMLTRARIDHETWCVAGEPGGVSVYVKTGDRVEVDTRFAFDASGRLKSISSEPTEEG